MIDYVEMPICDDDVTISKESCEEILQNEDAAELNWEKEYIISDKLRDEVESMWEIPQIFHFLQLSKEALNITNLSMYEMERMFLMPKASKQLANIMTCLLSSPNLKTKLHKIPPMPYEFWTNILVHKVKSWFKIYHTKQKNTIKVFESIGVEPEFWKIFTDISCIEEKKFEELTLKQRVWLLKTLCDTVMHNRKTIQEELLKQPWENRIESILGIDRHGSRYIYFPQFLQNNLRVYRQCLDNKIYSTVKSPPIKEEPKTPVKDDNTAKSPVGKTSRNRRRKSRWRNGTLPYKGRKRKEREKRKKYDKLLSCPFNPDAVMNLLSNETRNLNESNSFSNNNNINYDLITATCSRNLSKTIENVENSDEFKCSFIKSNENDASRSYNTISPENKMFKGFKSSCQEEANMKVICDILDELTSKIESSHDHSDLEKNNHDFISSNCEEVNKIISRSSSNMNAENLKFLNKKLPEMTSEKKEDEIVNEDLQNDEVGLDKWLDALSRKKRMEEEENSRFVQKKKESEHLSKSIKREPRSNSISPKKLQSEIKEDSETANNSDSEYESSLIELRDSLINEASVDDLSSPVNFTNHSNNIRNITKIKEDWNNSMENFNEMLTDLSASTFELVADSVETLRTFIESLYYKENNSDKSNKVVDRFVPTCEINLIRKMSSLLKSAENMEADLKDSTEKARSKLQREWLDFKNGVVEDQDSSCETGSSSNWWIIGSQGCALQISEATLHSVPHSALSPSGSQNQVEHSDSECDKRPEHQEPKEKCKVNDEENNFDRRKGSRNFNNDKEEGEQEESEDDESESEELKQQTKRVLRARGISSYTEQLLSDNSEAEDLERWIDYEAVYSASSVIAGSTSPHTTPQTRKSDKRSEAEDSDQDWILPSSRKRRNKRQSASRRLKSFQNKLQSIKVNSNLASSPTTALSDVTEEKEYSSRPSESETKKELPPEIPSTSISCPSIDQKSLPTENPEKIVPSLNPANVICKVECVDSVHSELDIKDEGPIIDPVTNNSNYNINVQQNYVVVKTEPPPIANYYLMQQNPPITGVVPQGPFMQQAAFVQSGISQSQQVHSVPSGYYLQNTPNYMVQSPQSGYGPHRHPIGLPPAQQMVLQQSQMMGQQVLTQPNYVQYMVNNSQQNLVGSNLPHPRMTINHRANYIPSHVQPRGQMNQQIRMATPRYQSRMPRQNFAHPNGAVIRSMPLTGNGRFPARNIPPRNIVPRQNMRHVTPRLQKLTKPNSNLTSPSKNTTTTTTTTSLIVLSDSDDEIEMIITEKPNETLSAPSVSSPRKNLSQPIQRRKPIVTSEVTVAKPKSSLPPQIVQRMSQGGISITPVKANPPPSNPNTQLVVVVNETGSHYALALPNGSKLILTPEQVAQIRASNGGKLIL